MLVNFLIKSGNWISRGYVDVDSMMVYQSISAVTASLASFTNMV